MSVQLTIRNHTYNVVIEIRLLKIMNLPNVRKGLKSFCATTSKTFANIIEVFILGSDVVLDEVFISGTSRG